MTQKILDALAKLNPADDSQWTEDGLPKMDTLKSLSGVFNLTRDQVTAAAPGFSRANMQLGATPVQPPASAPAAPVAPPPSAPQDQAATQVAPVQPAAPSTPATTPETGNEGQAAQAEPDQSLASQLKAAEARLERANGAKAEADREVAEASKLVDELLEKGAKVSPQESLAEGLSAYFAQQQRIREERGRRLQAMKGIDLRDILPAKAPIDAAFARKTQRGTQRPT